MIVDYFGFREEPFRIAPDPERVFPHREYRAARRAAAAAIGEGRPLVLLVGDAGTGKSMLLHDLRCSLTDAGHAVLFFAFPPVSPAGLWHDCCRDAGLAPIGETEGDTAGAAPPDEAARAALEAFLAEAGGARRPVLLLDEAQGLTADVLAELARLAAPAAERPRLQVLLASQPAIDALLSQPGLRSVRRDIMPWLHLGRIGDDEVGAYIDYRLASAGYDGPPLFSRRAVAQIAAYGRGVPQLINRLCNTALVRICLDGRDTVTGETIEEAAAEVLPDPAARGEALRTTVAAAWPGGAGPGPVPLRPAAPATAMASASIGGRDDPPVRGRGMAGMLARVAVLGLLAVGVSGAAWYVASREDGGALQTAAEAGPAPDGPPRPDPGPSAGPGGQPAALAGDAVARAAAEARRPPGTLADDAEVRSVLRRPEASSSAADAAGQPATPDPAPEPAADSAAAPEPDAIEAAAVAAPAPEPKPEALPPPPSPPLPPAPPRLTVAPATGREGMPVALAVSAEAQDAADLEVTVAGLPDAARLSAGEPLNGDLWRLAPDDLDGLALVPPPDWSGEATLRVAATALGPGGETATASEPLIVTVAGIADPPRLSVADAAGEAGTPIPLAVTAAAGDDDGSETLSVRIAGLPADAVLSAGDRTGDGAWMLAADALDGLTVTVPAAAAGRHRLTVEAEAREADGDAATAVASLTLTAEAPAEPAAPPGADLAAAAAGPGGTEGEDAEGSAEPPRPAGAGEPGLPPEGDLEAAQRYLERGDALFGIGDVASARLFYELALAEGSVRAATALGRTYDPLVFRESGVRGIRPDARTALDWYGRASEAGEEEAAGRHEALSAWLNR